VAGAIPIVQALKESLAGNRIVSLTGILNGTAKLHPDRMTGKGLEFREALEKAQAKGYAEADPTLDIKAWTRPTSSFCSSGWPTERTIPWPGFPWRA
jgi:homoserine dehydrogenase